MLEGRRLYAAITAFYALSRLCLYVLGVRYAADYAWQHFHDPDLLKDRLWETLLYTHAFTPFINLIVGVVLKISEEHSLIIYQALFLCMGTAFVNSLAYLMRAFRLPAWLTLCVVGAFALSPAFIYFESFLHYEFLAAALLAVSAALFHAALVAGSFRRWFSFFLVCALIAYVRTTFHLVWLVAVVVLGCLFQLKPARPVWTAALLPVCLVLALYAKNQVMFGFFGTSSMFGFNLAFVTTRQLSKSELKDWIAKGKIHAASGVSVYAPPKKYARWVDLSQDKGVPVLDRQMRQNGEANFNHWSYAEISKIRMRDNRYYLKHRKRRYRETVKEGLLDYFNPTTRWHPHDAKRSPHGDNRKVLGRWEDLYNHVWHGLYRPPYGVYLLMLPFMAFALGSACLTLWRTRLAQSPADKLVVLLAMNVVYVPLISCLVTIGELERYRLLVEAPMWLLTLRGAFLLSSLVRGRLADRKRAALPQAV